MAGNGKPNKPQPSGWGDDDKKDGEAIEPLSDKEIFGLREILKRHGYDSGKGSF